MTEGSAPAATAGTVEIQAASRSAVEAVDAVVAGLDALDELEVGQHVAVYEQAHESLRRALGDASQG